MGADVAELVMKRKWIIQELRRFEEKYRMSSAEFYEKWSKGEIPGPEDPEVVAHALYFGDCGCFGGLHGLPPFSHLISIGGSLGATSPRTTRHGLRDGAVIGRVARDGFTTHNCRKRI